MISIERDKKEKKKKESIGRFIKIINLDYTYYNNFEKHSREIYCLLLQKTDQYSTFLKRL